MLGAPPPGFNTSPINRQTVNYLSVPGYQGGVAQGYNPGASSFAQPSSAHFPSAMVHPPGTPGGAMPPGMPLGMSPQMMAHALTMPRAPGMR